MSRRANKKRIGGLGMTKYTPQQTKIPMPTAVSRHFHPKTPTNTEVSITQKKNAA
jgi:hypothetical protein